MANITVTHTFVNGTPADATEVNTNFSDIIAGTSDGTKDFSISALTVAGTANFSGAVNLNGSTTTLGNAITDNIVFTGRVASDFDPIATATYSFGSTSLTWKDLYLDNGATDGGAIFFNASASSFIKSDAAGTDLDISGFTNLDLNGLAITGAAGASFDGEVTINESGASVDFRVEGDTQQFLLFCDGSADNVGINESEPTSQLHIKADAANDVNSGFLFEATGNTDKLFRLYQESAAVDTRARMELYFADALTHVFDTGGNSYINTGNFGIGTTSIDCKLHVETSSGSGSLVKLESTNSVVSGLDFLTIIASGDNDISANYILFSDGDGTTGSVSAASATTVAYNTSSDSRLKNDLGDWDALSLINEVTARKYERKKKPGRTEYGFFAQELHEVLPQAVTVPRDGNDDPYANPWMVDYGKVTGVLWKAIQELKAELDAAKARIETLENT